MPARISRVIVSVSALEYSLEFYRDLLGLTGSVAERFARLDAGVEVLLHERPSAANDASVALSFAVVDVDRVVETYERSGGVVVDRPADQAWGERLAVVRDPDGHVVCLTEAR